MKFLVIGFAIGVTIGFASDMLTEQAPGTTSSKVLIPEAQANTSEVQVPNLPHTTKMMLISKTQTSSGTTVGVFRVTGWKSGVDSFTKSEADCGSNSIRDLAHGEGSLKAMAQYPANMQNYFNVVGDNLGGGLYQGSTSYNRYRALCG